jgi:hypothetical protein
LRLCRPISSCRISPSTGPGIVVEAGISHANASLRPDAIRPTWSRYACSSFCDTIRQMGEFVVDSSKRDPVAKDPDLRRLSGGLSRRLPYDSRRSGALPRPAGNPNQEGRPLHRGDITWGSVHDCGQPLQVSRHEARCGFCALCFASPTVIGFLGSNEPSKEMSHTKEPSYGRSVR